MQVNEYDRARAALAYVPNHERDTWWRMGMALKSAFGEAGAELWDEWSQGADNYDAASQRASWKSFDEAGAITIASLYHEAKQHGWKPNGSGPVPEPTPEELAERERRRQEAKERDAREAAEAAVKAKALWNQSQETAPHHPYWSRKGVVAPSTARQIEASEAAKILGYAPKAGGDLLSGLLAVLPIKVGDNLAGVELIDGQGRKAVNYGAKVSGGYWAAQPLPHGDGEGATIGIGEGAATVLSVRKATGHFVIAARSCGNLRAVAEAMRARYPKARIVILADVGNGENDAREAAAAVDALLAVPDFGPNRPDGAKDWNDLHQLGGMGAVKKGVEAAQPPKAPEAQPTTEKRSEGVPGGSKPDEWGEPEPLMPSREAQPYPLEAWPGKIGAAIREVLEFTKTPPALVAHSALAALSVAGQGLADVRRGEGLEGPISLYALILCESGERKTAVDKLLIEPIKEWERDRREADRVKLAEFLSERDAWEQQREGIKAAIREAARRGNAKAKGSDKE